MVIMPHVPPLPAALVDRGVLRLLHVRDGDKQALACLLRERAQPAFKRSCLRATRR